ncbi:class II fructose-bisphosphate aldolase [Candidatus Enterococcus ferrettii]|uniref:Fructose-bisphosphate aldolase, class II n=1 Tax=Candidatus Enterococcus ferrettii TaxID=2815324 RepID=A0ABV0ELQ4_9ENTE|nr:class II fructose-bisphosphate aldolase [Enterococcus sp. 665A]MBO1338162.1 class II fructose-bisphosphate aldolase [Enterococcus sp. 665A]
MLADLKEVLVKARSEKIAIAAFNVPNLEMVRAAISAAEQLNLPVILQHAEGHDSLIPLEEIGPIMLQYAKQSKVPVVVHLDHGKSFAAIVRAMKLGFTSVMIDASDLPFEENIARTKEIVKIAHSLGVSVEAELGHVFTSSLGGGEGRVPDDNEIGNIDIYTDPAQAKQFVAATGVDCLAIAFGTVHGIYLNEPKLDLNRVEEVYKEVGIPLVMHGGSGVSAADYQRAIDKGIAKINYYTYANKAGGAKTKDFLTEASQEYFLEDCVIAATEAVKADYLDAMQAFSRNKKNL